MSIARKLSKLAFASADVLLPKPNGPRLLIYHRVGTSTGQQMEVTTEAFKRQLDWLLAGFEVVGLESAISRWEEPGAENLIVLTFDDGYRDTFTTAYPIMLERAIPFTLYLTTSPLEVASNQLSYVESEALSWDQAAVMMESGLMTVGSHTHTHIDLRKASSGEVQEEVSQSNSLIERRLGVTPRNFAYPWGYWSAIAHTIVSEAYESATLGGSHRAKRTADPHRLNRYPVQQSDEFAFFKARVRGGLLLEELVRRRLRGYSGP